jgi:hypothetical protein
LLDFWSSTGTGTVEPRAVKIPEKADQLYPVHIGETTGGETAISGGLAMTSSYLSGPSYENSPGRVRLIRKPIHTSQQPTAHSV